MTNKDFIYALGLLNYDGVIVGIGVILKRKLCNDTCRRSGEKHKLAKAGSEIHARILKKVGADKIIYPEMETGRRIANQLVHVIYAI